jgi:hypothetical protein
MRNAGCASHFPFTAILAFQAIPAFHSPANLAHYCLCLIRLVHRTSSAKTRRIRRLAQTAAVLFSVRMK